MSESITQKIEVYLQELCSPSVVDSWDDWFQTWVDTLIDEMPQAEGYELTLRLTDDTEIQALNSQYRGKNQPTDVLAFAALEADIPQPIDEITSEPLYLGDIVISIDTATRQAQEQNHSLSRELAWLASHGFLHLLGWDHPDEETLVEMLSMQETLLKAVSLI